MKKVIIYLMIFCLIINFIFYLFELEKAFSYDSFIFSEIDTDNTAIVIINVALMIIIVGSLVKPRISYFLPVVLFPLVWLNNLFIIGISTLEAIVYLRYIYPIKLIFTLFSCICLLISFPILIMGLYNRKKKKVMP